MIMKRPVKTILIIVVSLIAVCAAYTAINYDVNHLLPRKMALHRNARQSFCGIDVSHHQGNIDWKKVKKAKPRLDFVYVKCTEGKTYVDPKFIQNVRGAAAQGYRVGAYHYFRMTSSAHDQFRNFKAQMDKVHLDLIPMVDVETNDKKPHKELQDSLQVLLNLLEKAYGKKPMIYGTQRSYNSYCAPEFNNYPLYIGKYSYSKPVVVGPSHYTIWQFSETGSISGFGGGVDLCRFHPDKAVNDIVL